MGRSKRSRVYHRPKKFVREDVNHSGKRRTIIQKLATTIHQVPLTFLPSSFRSPPVGPQVYMKLYMHIPCQSKDLTL